MLSNELGSMVASRDEDDAMSTRSTFDGHCPGLPGCQFRFAGDLPIGLRRRIWDRDNWTCQYCEIPVTRANGPAQRSTDHIVARSAGGCDHPANLITCCKRCNTRKGQTPFTQFRAEERLVMSGIVDRPTMLYLRRLATSPSTNPLGLAVAVQVPEITVEVQRWADIMGVPVTAGPFQITLTMQGPR